MAYQTVQDAIDNYAIKYPDLKLAIQAAQKSRAAAASERTFEFWNQVVNHFKSLLPPKQFKKKEGWQYEPTYSN